jgi:hypothetical protein
MRPLQHPPVPQEISHFHRLWIQPQLIRYPTMHAKSSIIALLGCIVLTTLLHSILFTLNHRTRRERDPTMPLPTKGLQRYVIVSTGQYRCHNIMLMFVLNLPHIVMQKPCNTTTKISAAASTAPTPNGTTKTNQKKTTPIVSTIAARKNKVRSTDTCRYYCSGVHDCLTNKSLFHSSPNYW